MDDAQVHKLLAWRTRATIDYMQLYLNLWIGFNSWFVVGSGIERDDRRGVEWVKSQSNLKNLYEKGFLVRKFNVSEIKILLEQHPMPPYKSYWSGKLDDEKAWSGVVEFLYQARCNLIHGRKNPEDFYDRKIIEFAYKCLYEIFEFIALEADGVTTYTSIMEWKTLREKFNDLDKKFVAKVEMGDVDSAKRTVAEMQNVSNELKQHVNHHIKTEWLVDG